MKLKENWEIEHAKKSFRFKNTIKNSKIKISPIQLQGKVKYHLYNFSHISGKFEIFRQNIKIKQQRHLQRASMFDVFSRFSGRSYKIFIVVKLTEFFLT